MDLSIVIPVYNEESRLTRALDDVLGWLKGRKESWEIVIVDDGSQDKTGDVVRAWMEGEPRIRFTRLPVNMGKGEAVRVGMLQAQGRIRLFRDSDLSTRQAELDRFLPYFEKGADVVIGSRRVPGATTELPQALPRRLLGMGFTRLCRLLILDEVYDYTCGFKCFSARASLAVFPKQRVQRWAFDAEILYLAKKAGFAIHQIPVTWRDEPGSKVRLSSDVFRSFLDMVRVRVNDLRGLYDA